MILTALFVTRPRYSQCFMNFETTFSEILRMDYHAVKLPIKVRSPQNDQAERVILVSNHRT